jgi:hypothetical protein
MKLITIAFLTVTAAIPMTAAAHLPVTDAEKIAGALRAGPRFITKDATLLDCPSTPGGEYQVLRKGSNGWTCLPAIPRYPHDELGVSMQYFCSGCRTAWLAGRRELIALAWRTCTVAHG